MFSLLLASIFLTSPYLYDMPKASSYKVTSNGNVHIEDRYDVMDMWVSRSLLGCWGDEQGRWFELFSLEYAPPPFTEVKTRRDFTSSLVPIGRRDKETRAIAIKHLKHSSCIDEAERFDQLPKGCKDFLYYPSTNSSAITAAFLPKSSQTWLLAVWTLAQGDDYKEKLKEFADKFFSEDIKSLKVLKWPETSKKMSERELHKVDMSHSVANHPEWYCTEAEEFTILDNMPSSRPFITILTNDLRVMRAKYAQVVPTPIAVTNTLSVARIYATRAEFLKAAGESAQWTKAYWCPWRRELVAYLSFGGEEDLLKTIRHEAFHQYLSYATGMIESSPWLNEGYAEYFENGENETWDVTEEELESYKIILPTIFAKNYQEFYSASESERALNYRLAWSIAYFLEHGAPKVRFDPFKNLKKRYFEKLIDSLSMSDATAYAFESKEKFDKFISEWQKFWQKR